MTFFLLVLFSKNDLFCPDSWKELFWVIEVWVERCFSSASLDLDFQHHRWGSVFHLTLLRWMRSILLSHLPQSSILLRLFLCSQFCLLCLGVDFYFYVAWDLLVFLNLWIIFLLVSSWEILTHDLFSPVPFSLSLLWNSFLNVPEYSFNLWSLLIFYISLSLCLSVLCTGNFFWLILQFIDSLFS